MTAQSRWRMTKSGLLSFLLDRRKGHVCRPNELEVFSGKEVQAVAQIYDGTDSKRVVVVAPIRFLTSPFYGAPGISFPKVGASTKPVEVTGALENTQVTAKRLFTNSPVAPVVTEHEGCEAAQREADFFPPNAGLRCPLVVYTPSLIRDSRAVF
jgi:hypothetical protein